MTPAPASPLTALLARWQQEARGPTRPAIFQAIGRLQMTNAFVAGERIPLDGFMAVLMQVLGKPGIYALTDPLRGHLVAYVGQSVDIGRRYIEHVSGTAMSDSKLQWTRDLRLAGLVPGLVVIEWCDDGRTLLSREAHWIKAARSCGLGWLNGPCCDPPDCEDSELADTFLDQAKAWALECQRKEAHRRRSSRSKEVLKVYRGILDLRAQHEAAKEKRRRTDYNERTERRQAKQFERRVSEEIERRMATQARELTSVARNLRVRVNNAARLGIRTVEAPEPRRS